LLTTGNLASASRQQTLRALIDWSYALLTDSERMMLRRLAVFAGGWTIDAAESVCAGELLPKDRVLEVMLRLADKSLLLVEERDNVFRYRMLETIRQYAAERLAESKDHADLGGDSGEERLVRIRHRDWCLRFAEEAGMGIGGADEVLWLERVEAEHDNLRSVLKRSLELREMDSGLRLAGTLWQFWLLRGHFTEGIQWMQRLLSEGSGDPALRAEALLAAASLSFRIGEMKAAKVFGMESLSLFDSQKNTSGAGRAAYALGILSWYTSDEASRPNELLSQSLGFAKESGLPLAMAAALNSMAFLACFEGDYPHAQDLLEHALSELKNGKEDSSARASFVNLAWATPVCDERGDWCMVVEETLAPFRGVGAQLAVGYTLANLGALARSGGDLARAKVMLSESLAEFRKAGDDAGIAQVLGQLGNLASSGQDFESAGALLEDSLALRKQLGDRRGMGRTLANLGMLATRMGDFARAHAHLEEGLALFRGMGDKPGLEQALSNLGTLALAEGDPRAALRIFTDVLTMHKQMGNKVIEALTLFNMGVAAKESGHGVNARQHLEDSLACYRPFGDPRIIATIRRHLRALPPQKNPRASDGRMKPARSRKKK
jgi:tetratricopeptide (TPR) repeat protein